MDAAPCYQDDHGGIRPWGAVAGWSLRRLWGRRGVEGRAACSRSFVAAVFRLRPAAAASAAVCWLFEGQRQTGGRRAGQYRIQPDARAPGRMGPRGGVRPGRDDRDGLSASRTASLLGLRRARVEDQGSPDQALAALGRRRGAARSSAASDACTARAAAISPRWWSGRAAARATRAISTT
jgi:hypothetical protein